MIIEDTKRLESKPVENLTRKEKAMVTSLQQKEDELVSLKSKLKENAVGKLEEELEASKPVELTNKESELKTLNMLVLERNELTKSLKSVQQSSRSLETIISKNKGGTKHKNRIIEKKHTKKGNKMRNKLTKKHKKVRFHKTTKKHM